MRVTLAQLNPTIGDFAGNLAKIEQMLAVVFPEQPDLVVFAVLFING
jgi:NAD+ synthase (glutamine-hydrolysing)